MPTSRKKLQGDKNGDPIQRDPFFSKFTLHKLDWLETIAIILSLWFFIYPKPYNLLLGALLAIPILGVLINGFESPSIASLVSVTKKKAIISMMWLTLSIYLLS